MSKLTKKTSLPKLRFPEFRDAPAWNKHIIEEYLTESRTKGSKGDVAKKITVKLWGKGVYEKNDEIKGSVNTQYYCRTAGQFIYSKLDFLNQAFGIIPKNLDNYESTVDLPCFDVNADINPIFLLEYVKRKEFYERLGEAADGSRKAKRIHADTFLNFPIFKPSVEEQQKIADCLSSVDELITAHTQKHEALKAHKKGLMQQLFPAEGETVPKLRFPEFREAGEWESLPLLKIGNIITGNTPRTSDKDNYGGDKYFVSPADISDKRFVTKTKTTLSEKGFSKTRKIPANSILFVCIGSTIGKVAQNKMECATNQQLNAVITFKKFISDFVYFALEFSSPRIAELAGRQAVPIINKTLFSSVILKIPLYEEQQRISDCLSSIEELITGQSQKIKSLKAHKKGLMQQLFPATDEVEA